MSLQPAHASNVSSAAFQLRVTVCVGGQPTDAGATIQVIMDISGVGITCFLCALLLPGTGDKPPPSEAIGDET